MDPNYEGGQDEQNSQFLGEDCHDGQNSEISVEDLESLLNEVAHVPDSFWKNQDNQGVAGTAQHAAPQGSSDELNSLNGSHLQSGDFGNQSVAGTEQPCPGALEFASNAIQTPLSYYYGESNNQQLDRLPAQAPGIQHPWMMQLGQPGQPGQPGVFNFIDPVRPLPVSGTQLRENQMPDGMQPLNQQQLVSEIIDPDQIKRDKKRAADRKYRKRKKEREGELVLENQEMGQLTEALYAENERLNDELEKLQEKQTKLDSEKEHLREENRLLNKRLKNSSREEKGLRGIIESMEKLIKNLGKQGIKKRKKDRS